MNTKARHIVLAATFGINLLFGGFHSHAEEPTTRLNAFPATFPDSTVIIFKKDDTVGVAVITNQRLQPDACDVQWFLRTDGSLDFSPSAPGLTSGTIKNTRRIKFGPFDSEWSCSRVGRGYVYLEGDYFTGVVVQPDLAKLSDTIQHADLIKNLTGVKIYLMPKKDGK